MEAKDTVAVMAAILATNLTKPNTHGQVAEHAWSLYYAVVRGQAAGIEEHLKQVGVSE